MANNGPNRSIGQEIPPEIQPEIMYDVHQPRSFLAPAEISIESLLVKGGVSEEDRTTILEDMQGLEPLEPSTSSEKVDIAVIVRFGPHIETPLTHDFAGVLIEPRPKNNGPVQAFTLLSDLRGRSYHTLDGESAFRAVVGRGIASHVLHTMAEHEPAGFANLPYKEQPPTNLPKLRAIFEVGRYLARVSCELNGLPFDPQQPLPAGLEQIEPDWNEFDAMLTVPQLAAVEMPENSSLQTKPEAVPELSSAPKSFMERLETSGRMARPIRAEWDMPLVPGLAETWGLVGPATATVHVQDSIYNISIDIKIPLLDPDSLSVHGYEMGFDSWDLAMESDFNESINTMQPMELQIDPQSGQHYLHTQFHLPGRPLDNTDFGRSNTFLLRRTRKSSE